MSEDSAFVDNLVATFPALKPLLVEHLEDHGGELLSYLLMGDVAHWLNDVSRAAPERAAALLNWLEDKYISGNFNVRDLIDVGIIEMLPASSEGDAVLELLGPHLRARAEVAGLV